MDGGERGIFHIQHLFILGVSCLPLARSLTKISGLLLSVPSARPHHYSRGTQNPVIQLRPRTEIAQPALRVL